jgi:hypothetical protein
MARRRRTENPIPTWAWIVGGAAVVGGVGYFVWSQQQAQASSGTLTNPNASGALNNAPLDQAANPDTTTPAA